MPTRESRERRAWPTTAMHARDDSAEHAVWIQRYIAEVATGDLTHTEALRKLIMAMQLASEIERMMREQGAKVNGYNNKPGQKA